MLRKENSGYKRKIHIIPRSSGAIIAMIAALSAEVFFLMLILKLDILPGKYMVLLLAVLLLIDSVALVLFNSRKKSASKVLAGSIFLVAVVNILVVGSYYLCSTFDTLQAISEARSQSEQYHVIVLKDGSYDEVEDIRGQDVYVIDNDSRMYKEAEEKLLSKVDVTYKRESDYMTAGVHIVNEKGETSDEIVFISNTGYEMLCEENKEFRKNTDIIYSVSVKIKTDDSARRINVTEDPFNIYITGIDVWGDIDQVSRSDVNMIVTVNPKTREVLLTSMPRDSYVELHSFGALDKLTHSGIYGVDETINTVEDWMGVDINYYIRVNFSMVVELVDAIGGIDVKSDYAFKSKVSHYRYVKGINHLDGKGALYFARERKAFKAEDEQRIRNQQIVLEAMLKKITSSKVLLASYVELLDAVEGKMQTNLTDRDIYSLVKMQLGDMTGWKVKTVAVHGKGAYRTTFSMGNRELFVSIPDEKSVEAAVKKIHEVMYPADDGIEKSDFLL